MYLLKDLLPGFFGGLLEFLFANPPTNNKEHRRPTIGEKPLPSKHKATPNAILIANILFWVLVLALLIFFTYWLSR